MHDRLQIVTCTTFLCFLISPVSLWSGQFRYGFAATKSMEATLNIPRPPDVYVGKKTVSIQVVDAAAEFHRSDKLRLVVERILSADFTIVEADPEATFKIIVTSFNPPTTQRNDLVETRRIKVGEKTVYGKDGRPKTFLGQELKEPVYKNRRVSVQYWEGSAFLSLRVDVVDSAGTAIDVFTPSASYNKRMEISVDGESPRGGVRIPSSDSILNYLLAQSGGGFRQRYCKSHNPVKFKLAVDEELRPGNVLAMAGNWEAALRNWFDFAR